MILPAWLIETALILGLSGMVCLIWGVLKNNRVAVRLGHSIVSLHMLMYCLGSGGYWFIGLGALLFAIAGFVYPLEYEKRRWVLWLILALPPGLIYLFAMGSTALFSLSGGM
jgi:hypothetical protein